MPRPKRIQSQENCNNLASETNKKKKSTITFSIDAEVLEELREDAEKEAQSINLKINNILSKHVFCYRYAEQQKSIIIPSKNFRYLVDNFDENKLLEQYRTIIFDTIPADLFERKTPLTIESWIKIVCKGMLLLGGSYEKFSYHQDSEGHLYLAFRHDHGEKWSKILASVYTQLIKNMLGYNIGNTTILPSCMVLKILEKNVLNI